jgi:hypothetical protein
LAHIAAAGALARRKAIDRRMPERPPCSGYFRSGAMWDRERNIGLLQSHCLQSILALIALTVGPRNDGSARASWPRLSRPSTPTRAKPLVALLES